MPSAKEDDHTKKGAPANQGVPTQIPYVDDKTITCRRYNESRKPLDMIFTHGAGGTLDAPAMVNFAMGFAANKSLLYFQGSMNLKARTKMFHALIEHEKGCKALGGRSMGARAAVLAAHDDDAVKALVLVSYPLKNEKGDLRDQILLELGEDVDVLFISGSRDEMCDLDELDQVRLKMKAKSWLVRVREADHGMNMKPKKATAEVGSLTGKLATEWLEERASMTECTIGWDDENGVKIQSSWGANSHSNATASKIVVGRKDARKPSDGKGKKMATQGADGKSLGSRSRASKSKVARAPPDAATASTTRETRSKKRKRG
jgi:predicted alpha/beta-hydrolase family hydrolase